jgi:hypothetical protein
MQALAGDVKLVDERAALSAGHACFGGWGPEAGHLARVVHLTAHLGLAQSTGFKVSA